MDSTSPAPTLTDLGVLPDAQGSAGTGGPTSEALAFNNVGDIVGYSDTKYSAYNTGFREASHAFLYSNGVMTDLGAIAGPRLLTARRTSVNDSHEIVGSTQTVSNTNGIGFLRGRFSIPTGTMYNLTFDLWVVRRAPDGCVVDRLPGEYCRRRDASFGRKHTLLPARPTGSGAHQLSEIRVN